MPIPYGASPSVPYPAFAPAPVPQMYNPLDPIPYPQQSYNYPGGFPQLPQYPPGTYPQQGYTQPQPGGYPQQPPPGGYPYQQQPPRGW